MATFRKQFRLPGGMLTFRSGAPDDAPKLLALMPVLHRETTFLNYAPGEFSMTEDEERAFLRVQAENPLSRFGVAEMDGAIIGTCIASIDARQRRRHMAGLGIALRKSHWRRGIGRVLLEDTLGWLRGQGVERAELYVDTLNHSAISLYMRLGFAVEGRILHERKLEDGAYRDAYRMALDLTAGPITRKEHNETK